MTLTALLRWLSPPATKRAFQHRRRNPQLPTVFIHIPKCAGTALARGLADALRVTSTLSGFDHCLFGGFTQFETITIANRTSIYAPTEPIPKDADLVAGHFAVSTVRNSYPNANYCIVLREPECRLLSHWLYWRQQTDGELAAWGDPWKSRVLRARAPLVDFLRDPDVACQTDNLALRMLLWPDSRIPANSFIPANQDRALLKAALARLQDFDFVGFIEDPDIAHNLEKWVGAPIQLKRMNETRAACAQFPVDLQHELTVEARALLNDRSRLDLVLWDEVLNVTCTTEDRDTIKDAAVQSAIEHHNLVQLQR